MNRSWTVDSCCSKQAGRHTAARVAVVDRHGVPVPLQAKNWASAAVAGMSLWQDEDPDGGTKPRGSIAENVHAPVPPPRPRCTLRRHSLVLGCRGAGSPFLDTAAPGRGATWNSFHARPGARAGSNAAGASTRRRSEAAARTQGEESVARSRARKRSGSRWRRAVVERAISGGAGEKQERAGAWTDGDARRARWRRREHRERARRLYMQAGVVVVEHKAAFAIASSRVQKPEACI